MGTERPPTSSGRIGKSTKRPWRLSENESFLVETTPIVLYRSEANAGFDGPRRVGPSLSEAIGFKPAAFYNDGALWPACIHPEDRPRVLARVTALDANESFAIEYRIQCADDSERIFLDRGIAVIGPDNMIEIHGSSLDVTEQRHLERRLLWSQRLESMGLVIDDLAHDFLNMLSVTIWNLDGMMRSIEANGVKGRDRDRVVAALTGANNGAALFKELMQVAKRLPPKIKARWIEPAQLLHRVEKLIRLLIGDQAALEFTLPEDLWPVTADEAQIESMVIALVLMAREGAARNGVLRIQGSNETRDASTPDLAAGDYLVLTIGGGGEAKSRDGGEPQRSTGRNLVPRDAAISDPLHLRLIENLAKQWGGQLVVVGVNRPGSAIRLLLPRTRATSSTQ
ncbi:MAG TPA: PAS domain-containing protein [Magnetospirillaceae bacterium]